MTDNLNAFHAGWPPSTRSKPKWDILHAALFNVFGPDQLPWVLGWLRVAVESYEMKKERPGQILVLVGPPTPCSAIVLDLITLLLNKREIDLTAAPATTGNFSRSEFSAVHFVCEERTLEGDSSLLDSFAGRVSDYYAERNGSDQRERLLPPLWRLSARVGYSSFCRDIRPHIKRSRVSGNLMVMNSHYRKTPVDITTPHGLGFMLKLIDEEIPAFVSYLLDEFTLPDEMVDERFGVRSYIHPMLSALCEIGEAKN